MTADDLKQTIMHAIRTDRIVMVPRMRFFAQTGLLIAAAGLTLTTGVFVVSFVHFVLRDNGLLELPRFGPPGLLLFIGGLPWLSIVFATATIAFLEILASRFAFVYKRPLVYSVVGSIVVVITGGVLLAYTSLHESAFRLSHEGRLPGFAPLYEHALYEPPEVTIGRIIDMPDAYTLKLLTRSGSTTAVSISSETKLSDEDIEIGDIIVVFGSYASSTIRALGIHPFDPDRIIFPRARRPEGFDDQPPRMRQVPLREISEPSPVYQ